MRHGLPTNLLLDFLPARDRTRVLAKCEQVELEYADVLDEPGAVIRDVYFPLGSSISLQASVGGENRLEVGVAGNEGVYGLPLAYGVSISPVRAVVQGGGSALRMRAGVFQEELVHLPAFRGCVDRYLNAVMSHLVQAAGCNRFHVVEQRVARWLLMAADRAHGTTFRITHESIAHMLGVRRVGVTEAASALQKRALIAYSRGVVAILDRKGLERAACDCYRADVEAYHLAFSGGSPAAVRRLARGAQGFRRG